MDDPFAFYLRNLHDLAPRMQKLTGGWWPRPRYHPLADAVYWTDEIPSRCSAEEESALRCLLRYRTTVILGRPEASLAEFWTAAQRDFPHWIGHAPRRSSPDRKVIEFHHRKADQFMKEFEENILPHIKSVTYH